MAILNLTHSSCQCAMGERVCQLSHFTWHAMWNLLVLDLFNSQGFTLPHNGSKSGWYCSTGRYAGTYGTPLWHIPDDNTIAQAEVSIRISNLIVGKTKSGGLRTSMDLRAINTAVIPYRPFQQQRTMRRHLLLSSVPPPEKLPETAAPPGARPVDCWGLAGHQCLLVGLLKFTAKGNFSQYQCHKLLVSWTNKTNQGGNSSL